MAEGRSEKERQDELLVSLDHDLPLSDEEEQEQGWDLRGVPITDGDELQEKLLRQLDVIVPELIRDKTPQLELAINQFLEEFEKFSDSWLADHEQEDRSEPNKLKGKTPLDVFDAFIAEHRPQGKFSRVIPREIRKRLSTLQG